MKKKAFIELVSYAVVGGVCTGFNLLLYWALIKIQVPYLIANSVSYVLAVLLNFVLNKQVVFKSDDGEVIKSLVKFIITRVGMLAFDNVCLWVAVDCLKCAPMISKIVLSFLEIMGTFIINKVWVFKTK